MIQKLPKPLKWKEPLAVRHTFYPAPLAARRSWQIFGTLVALGVVLLVLLIHNDDPNAKWFMLAMGFLIAGFFAVLLPSLFDRSRSICRLADFGISRHDPFPTFAVVALIHRGHDWNWRVIGKLRLTMQIVAGVEQRILWMLDCEQQVLGCVGLSEEISPEALDAWAQAKQRPFEIVSGT